MSDVQRKTGPARPRKNQSRVQGGPLRPDRIPLHGNRDILNIRGKNPEFEYRWVKDIDETGQRIFAFAQAGWHFAPVDDIKVGQNFVYKSQDDTVGSIVRVPDRSGGFLYLMRISREYYEEDASSKEANLRDVERGMSRERKTEQDDGVYGQNTIDNRLTYWADDE